MGPHPQDSSSHDKGVRAVAKADFQETLADVLRDRVAHEGLAQGLARSIFAGVFDVMAADEEFGPDPDEEPPLLEVVAVA